MPYSYDPHCFDGPNNIGEDGKILIISLFLYRQSIKAVALKKNLCVKYEVLQEYDVRIKLIITRLQKYKLYI
jgi:hypothetical protein